MYEPTTGRWLSEDPIGFLGEDANLYRYVANSATNATDPSGLVGPPRPVSGFRVDANNNALMLQVMIKIEFQKEKDWTIQEQDRVKTAFKKQVEETWNNHPFRLVPGKGDALVPKVQVLFVDRLSRPPYNYTVVVKKERSRGPGDEAPYVKDDKMYVILGDINDKRSRILAYQGGKKFTLEHWTVAHEFGHLLGFPHPGSNWDPQFDQEGFKGDVPPEKKGPNRREAYLADPYAVMGFGSHLRGGYFEAWREYLNSQKGDSGRWKVEADKQHKLYKDTHENWKKYARDRYERVWEFVGGGPRKPHPLQFDDNEPKTKGKK